MRKNITDDDVSTRIMKVLKTSKGTKNNNDFAKELDITPSALSNYQLGRLPQLDQLIKIRNNLELPFGYLLGEIDVTHYGNDTENTFGLSSECIRKLEKLNNIELKCLSELIVNLSSDLLNILSEYSKLPLIEDSMMPLNSGVSPYDLMTYRMQDEYIKKIILKEITKTIDSLKPTFENIGIIHSKEGKKIINELTEKLTKEYDLHGHFLSK